jgi:RNA polymerase primary sigma factor
MSIREDRLMSSPLEIYLHDVSRLPLLRREEEKRLAALASEGDKEARDRLVCANLRLVVNVARWCTGRGVSLLDLIEEGNLGLLRAADGLPPSMAAHFSGYACYWVQQFVKRAIVDAARTIRLPGHVIELLARWRRAAAGLHHEMGQAPTEEEVARALDLPEKTLDVVKRAVRAHLLASGTDEAVDVDSLGEVLLDERDEARAAELAEADDVRHALDLLGHLPDVEASVLRLRFGLGDDTPRTLKEVGERLGLTRERVRQIESEALSKLRESMSAR